MSAPLKFPSAATRKRPPSQPSEKQQKQMQRARWMVAFCHNYGLPCWPIVRHLENSSMVASGPALRLAQAVWNLHALQRFPHSKPLQIAERQSAGHLHAAHNPRDKAQYHVWQGILAFQQLRRQHVPTTEEEPPLLKQDLSEADWRLPDSFFRLQKRWEETGKPYLEHLICQALTINSTSPQVAEAFRLFSETVWRLEKWRSLGCPPCSLERQHYLQAQKAWLRYAHSHPWLLEEAFFGPLQQTLDDSFTPPP